MQIADKIRQNIAAGKYPNGKLPSERGLTLSYGISRNTAAKVLSHLANEGLIVRRRGSGAFIRGTSKSRESTYVSTLIADMDVREFFSAICGAIADRARAYNLNLVWGAKRDFSELSRGGSIYDYIVRCKEANIKGVFFVPQDAMGERGVEKRNIEIANTLRMNGITVVLIDRDIVPFPSRSDFDFVGIDNIQAGYSQGSHLVKCGCRRPIYVSHEKQVWTVDARFNGFRNAVEESGVATGDLTLFRGDPNDDAFVKSIIRERPDGIAFIHDDMAIAFMDRWSRLSRRKPKYIGFDDIAICRHIGMSSIKQPARFIGEEAARLMSLRLGHDTLPPRHVLFSSELMARASTTAVAAIP